MRTTTFVDLGLLLASGAGFGAVIANGGVSEGQKIADELARKMGASHVEGTPYQKRLGLRGNGRLRPHNFSLKSSLVGLR